MSCHLVFFRVRSVGVGPADDGITPQLVQRGCSLGQPPCGDGHGFQKTAFRRRQGAGKLQRLEEMKRGLRALREEAAAQKRLI